MIDLDPLHLEYHFTVLWLAMDSSKIRPSPVPHGRTLRLPCHLSSVIKVLSFGVSPPPPKGDDLIYVQPLWHSHKNSVTWYVYIQ